MGFFKSLGKVFGKVTDFATTYTPLRLTGPVAAGIRTVGDLASGQSLHETLGDVGRNQLETAAGAAAVGAAYLTGGAAAAVAAGATQAAQLVLPKPNQSPTIDGLHPEYSASPVAPDAVASSSGELPLLPVAAAAAAVLYFASRS